MFHSRLICHISVRYEYELISVMCGTSMRACGDAFTAKFSLASATESGSISLALTNVGVAELADALA